MASSTCNKSFCRNYMLLKPEEASLLELSKILFSSDIAKRKFVDCPVGTREPFGQRWVMFLSLMMQKFLQATSKPLDWFGTRVEHWLNLLSGNGGFFKLMLNSLRGKVNHPDKESETFLSFIGNIDKRIQLDSSISREDKRYHAALSIMAAKVSYENKKFIESTVKNHWEMDFVDSYDFWNDYQEKDTTQAFILDDKKDTIVVAFRGTEPFDANAWSSDVDLSWYDLPEQRKINEGEIHYGKIHGGFMKALGLQKNDGWPEEQAPGKKETAYYAIRRILKERLKDNDKAKFILTGHSLGGALAVLFPAVLAMHGESWLLDRLEGVYTFGQPRVGDKRFGEFMKSTIEKHDVKWYRFVYSYDVVPRLPYDDSTFMFKHFGTCVYYNSFYEGKIVGEEPDKNYFSIIWLLPKIANACWELIRSFTMQYTKGPEYKEGGMLRMFRVLGLLIAGVPAHCPQDYVNAIRLGSANVFGTVNLSSNDQKVLKVQ